MKYTLPVRMQGGEGAAACRAAAGRVRDVEWSRIIFAATGGQTITHTHFTGIFRVGLNDQFH
jgi:hypothetical protein